MSINPTEIATPEGQAQPAVNDAPAKENIGSPKSPRQKLTDDVLKEFVDGKRQLTDFTPAQAREFHSRFVKGSEKLPDKTAADDKSPEQKPTAEKPKAEAKETDEKPKGNWVPGDKYFQKATEANDYKQKFDSLKRRHDEIEGLVKDLQAKQAQGSKSQDLYSEEFLKGLTAKVENLESVIQKNVMSEMESLKEERKRMEIEGIFSDLEGLQARVSGLKTSRPFRDLDRAYVAFQRDVGGPEARQKFLEDPEFRKQKEAQGYHFPMSEADFKRYARIAEIHRFRAEKGYPTLSSAYADYKEQSGFQDVQPEQTSSVAEQATKQVAQKLAERADEPTLLPPTSGGSGVKGSAWTLEKAEGWMKAHPRPSTREEKATQLEIHTFLRNELQGR